MQLTQGQTLALENYVNMLVEAGAGSGKTFLYVERYCQQLMQDSQLEPSNILALTFTKKAASECLTRIYTRLESLVDQYPHFLSFMPQLHLAPITTFHGFCVMMLKEYAFYIEQSPIFTVLGDDEQVFLFKQAINKMIAVGAETHNKDLKCFLLVHSEGRLITDLIQCFYKREKISAYEPSFIQTLSELSQALLGLFKLTINYYDNLKHQRQVLDYVDLIAKANLLLDHHIVQQKLREQFRFIMIDECQDTDPLQWQLLLKCCDILNPMQDRKLFLVGDSKQCIYRFRGAELGFFDQLRSQFTQQGDDCRVVQLEDNFRSSPDILAILNPMFHYIFSSIGHTPLNFVPLTSSLDINGQVQAGFLKDETTDPAAEFNYIYAWLQQQDLNQSIAILARERRQCDAVFEFLKSKGIAVQTDKQKGFFAQQLVIDCFLLLKGIIEPADLLAWNSLLQSPLFNLSQSMLTPMFHVKSSTIVDVLTQALTLPEYNAYDRQIISSILVQIECWLDQKNTHSLVELLQLIFLSPQGQAYVASQPNGQYQLDIFLTILMDLELTAELSRFELLELLEFKLTNHDSAFELPQDGGNVISIMTIHAAKGLEFDTVIVCGCHRPFVFRKSDPTIIDNAFFHCSAGTDDDKAYRQEFFLKEKEHILAEEKRLFYVACTRAKQTLLLTGLFHKAEAGSCFSYLSFIKSLPKFQDNPQSIQFVDNNGHDVEFFTQYQSLAVSQKDEITTDEQSVGDDCFDQQAFDNHVTSILHISDIVKDTSMDLSLQLLTKASLGSIVHTAMMYMLDQSDLSLDTVLNFCYQHVAYRQLSDELKQELVVLCKELLASKHVALLATKQWTFEYPLHFEHDFGALIGRVDAVCFDTSIIFLEIKTDVCDCIDILYDRYKQQLQLYAFCLMQSRGDQRCQGVLYSCHLDECRQVEFIFSQVQSLVYDVINTVNGDEITNV